MSDGLYERAAAAAERAYAPYSNYLVGAAVSRQHGRADEVVRVRRVRPLGRGGGALVQPVAHTLSLIHI